eukprot:3919035-Amphidinium_carterae.1
MLQTGGADAKDLFADGVMFTKDYETTLEWIKIVSKHGVVRPAASPIAAYTIASMIAAKCWVRLTCCDQ